MMSFNEHYILWFWAFVLMVLSTGLYIYRVQWIPYLEQVLPKHAYQRLQPSFSGDIEAGLSSNTFNLTANLEGGDARAGLNKTAKNDVLKIMKSRKVGFDEARRIYTAAKFTKNGIASDGRPTDPRAVFFS